MTRGGISSKPAYEVVATLRHGGSLLVDHILNTEQDTLRFRLLALVIAAVSLYFSEEDTGNINLLPASALSIVYLVYTILLGRVILSRISPGLALGQRSVYLVSALILIDTLAVTTMLYLVGGPENMSLILIPLFIVYHSIYLGYFSGLISATFFSLFFVVFALLWGKTDFLSSYITLQIPLFYLLAIASGYISERRLKDRWEKDELEHLLLLQGKDRGIEMIGGLVKGKDLDSVLEETVNSSTRITGLSYGLIALLDEKDTSLIGRAGNISPADLNLQRLSDLVFDCNDGLATVEALRTGQSVIFADTLGEEKKLPGWTRWLGVRVMVVVSLVAGGRNWGVMYLFATDKETSTIPRDRLNTVKNYARMAADALVRERLRRP